jgi:hypothetical protein
MAPGLDKVFGAHTSRFLIDEECMAVSVAYYLSVVQEYFGQIKV